MMAATHHETIQAEVNKHGFAEFKSTTASPKKKRSSQIAGDPRKEAGCAEARAALGLPPTARDPLAELVPRLLEVFPDMEQQYALTRLRFHFLEQGVELGDLVKAICAEIVEGGDSYTRVLPKGKRKASEEIAASKPAGSVGAATTDYYQTDKRARPNQAYRASAASLLRIEFPEYPASDCARMLDEAGGFFASARKNVLALSRGAEAEVLDKDTHAPAKKKAKRADKGSGKSKEGGAANTALADSLQRRSVTAVREKLNREPAFNKAPAELKAEVQWIYSDEGEAALASDEPLPSAGIECGCCFDDEIPFERFVQCRDGHLFCKSCAQSYAEERIGIRVADLQCIHADGCEAGFAESEIQRFLPDRTYALLNKLRQELSIQRAGIDGLESCPFCPYACVMEDPDNKIFQCMNEECERASCRACREDAHVPLSCDEARERAKDDRRHDAENRLSESVIRKCPTPKCGVPLMKSDGCNKVLCTQCKQYMCYVCKESIPASVGYGHFHNPYGRMRPGEASPATKPKCPLWDSGVDRHDRELEQARQELGDDAPPP